MLLYQNPNIKPRKIHIWLKNYLYVPPGNSIVRLTSKKQPCAFDTSPSTAKYIRRKINLSTSRDPQITKIWFETFNTSSHTSRKASCSKDNLN